MKFQTRKLNAPRHFSHGLELEIPQNCPKCGIANRPIANVSGINKLNYNPKENFLFTVNWQCASCDEYYLTGHLRLIGAENKNVDLLFIYPEMKVINKLPENVVELSPRFEDIYRQAEYSEQAGHLEIAGIGYRLALEILIKDFAIKELNKPENEVSRKKLFNAISEYLPSIDLQNVADVIRMKGNDYAHFKEKYEHVDFETLKTYIKIFIQLIKTQLLIKHPPIGRNN